MGDIDLGGAKTERLKCVRKAGRPAGRRLPSRGKRRLGASVEVKEKCEERKNGARYDFPFFS